MAANGPVGAAVEAQPPAGAGVAAGRGDEVDGSAKQRAAEPKGVAALVDLGVPREQRVDQLEVAVAVRLVERHAVLGEQGPAVVRAVADAGAADRQPGVAAPLLLGVDAGHVAQQVGDPWRKAAGVAFGGDHGHGAGRL